MGEQDPDAAPALPPPVSIADGVRGRWWRSTPESSNGAAVVVSHGVFQQGALYEPVARRLAAEGFDVLCYDHPGCGASGGPQDTKAGFDYGRASQALQAAARAARDGGASAVFVLGHSLGGLVASLLATSDAAAGVVNDRLVDGWILSSPSVGAPLPALRLLRVLRHLPTWVPLGRPSLSEWTTNADLISRWEALDDAVPAKNRVFTAKYAVNSLEAIRTVRARLHMFQQPLLVLHGELDRSVADHGGCDDLHRAVGDPLSTLMTYPSFKHEVLFEAGMSCAAGTNVVMDDVVKWLSTQMAQLSGGQPAGHVASPPGSE